MRSSALVPLGLFVGIATLLGIGLGLNPRLVPSPLIVDGNGIIRYKHIGSLDDSALGETVLRLMRALQAEPRGAGSPAIPQV